MSHFFLIPTLKEFKKLTNICQSYSKNKSGPVFSDSQCILAQTVAYVVMEPVNSDQTTHIIDQDT